MEENENNSIVSVKDLLGFSKPLMKLIDVVAKGTGILYKPTSIRNESQAKADEIRYIAQAEADKLTIVTKAKADCNKMLIIADSEIEERIRARITSQEFQRQHSIESISEQAELYLPDTVSGEPLEDDWVKRFFTISQDISNEKLQDVWARILAGEITQPGSYSLRTLATIKNMTQAEAEMFQTACNLVFETGHIFKINTNDLEEFGLTFSEILVLRSCGIIHDGDNLNAVVTTEKDSPEIEIKNNGTLITFYHQDKKKTQHVFQTYTFTSAGRELSSLITNKPNSHYLDALKAFLEQQQYTVEIAEK